MDILTKYYIKELLAKTIKTSAIHSWMKSKGVELIVETNTKDGAYEFIRNNQASYSKELLMYCGGESPAFGGGYIYYVVEMPDISDDELTNLEKVINGNAIGDTEKSVRKIAFWVKFWSIITLIGIGIGAIVLVINMINIDNFEDHKKQEEIYKTYKVNPNRKPNKSENSPLLPQYR